MIVTLPKTNMDPKNDGLEEEFPFNYGDFFCVHVSFWGVVAIGHDDDLRISDGIVTTINPHLHNLHITADIVCPQSRKAQVQHPSLILTDKWLGTVEL